MNELGTITQDFRTPFMEGCFRSARKAAAKATEETRARHNAYYREHYCGTFTPSERWKRCAGDDERRDD